MSPDVNLDPRDLAALDLDALDAPWTVAEALGEPAPLRPSRLAALRAARDAELQGFNEEALDALWIEHLFERAALDRRALRAAPLGGAIISDRRQRGLDLRQNVLKLLAAIFEHGALLAAGQRIKRLASNLFQHAKRVGSAGADNVAQSHDHALDRHDLTIQIDNLRCELSGHPVVHSSSPVGRDSRREPRPGESAQDAVDAGANGGRP